MTTEDIKSILEGMSFDELCEIEEYLSELLESHRSGR